MNNSNKTLNKEELEQETFEIAPDQDIRDLAIDSQQSFIVQAPAGAGKTSLLTQRILNLLTIVDNPEEVVAVTFTRKAAAEMRNRLLEELINAGNPEPVASHEKVSWRLANKVMHRNQELNWNLLENPHRLRILTIDALSSLIANQMPLLSQLGGSLAINSFAQDSYNEAAKAVLNYLDNDDFKPHIINLLSHLDNQVEKLVGLLAKMLAKRDQWLRLLGAGDLDIKVLQQGIDEIAKLRLEQLSQFEYLLDDPRLIAGLNFAAGYISADHDLSVLRTIGYLPEFDFKHLAQWKAIGDFCLTASGTFRKSLNKNQGLVAAKDLEDSDKVIGKKIKSDLKELFESWSENNDLLEALIDVNNFPRASYSQDQQNILESLLKLLRLATIELSVDFQSKSEADFIEIALAADRALGFFEDPSELVLKLDYQISHILVDEFQDTSFTQYQLLSKLIAGWQYDDGRTLFLVGDPMQSIYRFREANVGLFIKTQQQGIAGFPVTSLHLSANFRSSPAIIDWVNRRFTNIFPQQDDVLLGAVSYSRAQAMKNDSSSNYVKFLTNFEQEDSYQADNIASQVASIRQKHPEESIAILVRGRSHAQSIAEVLRANQIIFYAKDMEFLRDKTVINDLVNMTRLLLQPQDSLAWLGLLKSPYIGLTLADISYLNEEFSHQYWNLLEAYSTVGNLSEDAMTRLKKVAEPILGAVKDVLRIPLSEVVERLWLQLGGPSALVTKVEIEEANAFFNVLLELEKQEQLIEADLIEAAIKDLYAQQKAPEDSSTGIVEIMTMHKSKGLEFDTVILPSLERRKRSDEHQLLLWEEFTSDERQHYLLAPIQAQEKKEPIYQLARDIQNKKAQFEDARLLYVAATRAKKRLILSCELKVAYNFSKEEWAHAPISKLSLLHYLQPHYAGKIASSFESLEISQDSNKEDSQLFKDWYRLKNSRTEPTLTNSFSDSHLAAIDSDNDKEPDFDWASDVARVVGLVVHRLLELLGKEQIDFSLIKNNNYQWVQYQLKDYLQQTNEIANALEKVKKAVKNLENDKIAQWLLHPHKDHRSEWSISGMTLDDKGQKKVSNFIIDRSFVDEKGVRWIVDYKTGEHLGSNMKQFYESEIERYRPQLDRYEQLLNNIESKPIKKALYFPMHKKMVEII